MMTGFFETGFNGAEAAMMSVDVGGHGILVAIAVCAVVGALWVVALASQPSRPVQPETSRAAARRPLREAA